MKLRQFLYTSFASIFCLILIQPAFAEQNQLKTKTNIGTKDALASLKSKLKDTKNHLGKTEKSISNIPQLSEVKLPRRSAKDLLAQDTTNPTLIQINGVRLQKTDSGLEVVLDTDGKQTAISVGTITTKTDGKTVVANINDAVLALPDGKEFQANTPADGIASLNIRQLDDNTVQVRIVGVEDIPTAQITSSDRSLILSLDPTPQPEIELTVTAQKRPENVQDVPLSVTVIPEQELEDAQIDSFQDIANSTPNFNFAPTSSGGTEFSYYSLRGLNNFNFVTAQDSVGFYVDDIPIDYNGFLDLALSDLERVEVLRGPQSTLYGRNSSGGVVNVISRQATPEPEIRFGASYGRYNSRELQFTLNDSLTSDDKLALRVSGAYRGQDGFIENLATGEKIGERARVAARAQLVWTPTPEWNISFNSYNSFTDDGNPTLNRGNAPDPFEVDLQTEGFSKLSTNTQAIKVSYNGDAFRATSITARRFSTQENIVPNGNIGIQIIDDINSTLWTQELRFQSPETADRFQWLLGGYYESRDFNVDDSITEFVGFGRTRRFGDDYRQTYAVFGQVDYKLTDPLTVFAGLRYESSEASSNNTSDTVNPDGTLTPNRPEFDAEVSDDELIPRFGLKYQFNPNLMVYGTIAKGYRPGGLNYRANSETELRFGEEKTWSYELGLKSSWLDDRLIANLAFFYNDVNDYQVLLVDQGGIFGNVTNIDIRATGVEFELKARPMQGLDLIASLGYVDSRYKNFSNPDTGEDLSDNRVPIAPQVTYNLAAQYRSPGGLFARAELRGYGITFFDNENEIKQEPYALVNTRIGYEAEKYGIYLYANNLFDTRYITSGFLFPPPDGTVGFGDPVTYGVQFKGNL
ncbi:MAG: TonB-dependent receptor [Cyanobacteria bacterium J06639_18]